MKKIDYHSNKRSFYLVILALLTFFITVFTVVYLRASVSESQPTGRVLSLIYPNNSVSPDQNPSNKSEATNSTIESEISENEATNSEKNSQILGLTVNNLEDAELNNIDQETLNITSTFPNLGLTFQNGVLTTTSNTKFSVGDSNPPNIFTVGSNSEFSVDENGNISADTLRVNQVVTSASSVGIIDSGTWNGSLIDSAYGGTGLSEFSEGDLLVGTANSELERLSAGNAFQVLAINSLGKVNWQDITGGSNTICRNCLINNPSSANDNVIEPLNKDLVSLVIKQSSQGSGSANLQEWKNYLSETVASMNPDGKLKLSDNSLIVGTQLFVTDNKIGIGTSSPTSNLEIFDSSSPKIKLSRDSGTYFNIQKRSSTGTQLQDVQQSGDALIDLDPIPSDGTSKSLFRFFRNVNTSGIAAFSIYRGDGSATINSFFSGNTNSYINAMGGNVGIGTSSPKYPLHVNGTIAPVSSQQSLGTSNLRWNIFASDGDFSGKIRAQNGLVTKVVNHSSGTGCSDADFTNPSDGTICIDQRNGRIYYRYGGAWHYSARTDGFQIPDQEKYAYDFKAKKFDQNKPLQPGDVLIPFVESELPDGSLHGMYTRFTDIIEGYLDDYIKKFHFLERLQALESRSLRSEVGTVLLESGTEKIFVSKSWEFAPSHVILTSDYNTNVWYENLEKTGFTIFVENPPNKEAKIHWVVEWQ